MGKPNRLVLAIRGNPTIGVEYNTICQSARYKWQRDVPWAWNSRIRNRKSGQSIAAALDTYICPLTQSTDLCTMLLPHYLENYNFCASISTAICFSPCLPASSQAPQCQICCLTFHHFAVELVGTQQDKYCHKHREWLQYRWEGMGEQSYEKIFMAVLECTLPNYLHTTLFQLPIMHYLYFSCAILSCLVPKIFSSGPVPRTRSYVTMYCYAACSSECSQLLLRWWHFCACPIGYELLFKMLMSCYDPPSITNLFFIPQDLSDSTICMFPDRTALCSSVSPAAASLHPLSWTTSSTDEHPHLAAGSSFPDRATHPWSHAKASNLQPFGHQQATEWLWLLWHSGDRNTFQCPMGCDLKHIILPLDFAIIGRYLNS